METGFTKIPNHILDEIMKALTGAEFKVFMAICRKTIGWQKEKDRISNSQLIEMTGLTERMVRYAIKSLTENGFINRTNTGLGKSISEYSVNIESLRGAIFAPLVTKNSDVRGAIFAPPEGQKLPFRGAKIAPTKEIYTKESNKRKREPDVPLKSGLFSEQNKASTLSQNKKTIKQEIKQLELFSEISDKWLKETGHPIRETSEFKKVWNDIIIRIDGDVVKKAVEAFLADEWRRDKPSARSINVLFKDENVLLTWASVHDKINNNNITLSVCKSDKDLKSCFDKMESQFNNESKKWLPKLTYRFNSNGLLYLLAPKDAPKEKLEIEFSKIGQNVKIMSAG